MVPYITIRKTNHQKKTHSDYNVLMKKNVMLFPLIVTFNGMERPDHYDTLALKTPSINVK